MRVSLAAKALPLLMTLGLCGCLRYEYEHELWLRVDGSGTIYVTGRPALWAAFKGVGTAQDPENTISRDEVRRLFERSGLRVRKVMRVRRAGRTYLFVSADFKDVNSISGSSAFPDLAIRMARDGDQLRLEGAWTPPVGMRAVAAGERLGLMAVRFHLPSKVHEHKNAFAGVERGNIVSWRQDVAEAFRGQRMEFGVLMERRSILFATVTLFLGSIVAAAATVALVIYLAYRRGKRLLAQDQ
jgi:hypothetical protein